VQAAEFLGCMKIQEDITKHLQTLLIEILERTEKIKASEAASWSTDLSLAVYLACINEWHSTQVCMHYSAHFYLVPNAKIDRPIWSMCIQVLSMLLILVAAVAGAAKSAATFRYGCIQQVD
jgi:hypothetical protein